MRASVAALAVACGIGCTAMAAPAQAGSYQVLYSFHGGSDGAYPGTLIGAGGTLYGTTGGGGGGGGCPDGCGTVFSFDLATGHETVIVPFSGESGDPAYPRGLIDVDGTLYGTSGAGGGSPECEGGCGTVFAVDVAARAYRTLYNFFDAYNGSPSGSLIKVGAKLYGATFGDIYSIDPKTGTVDPLYSFPDNGSGGYGGAALTSVGGTLYGTTGFGGTSVFGTVFSFDVSEKSETVLYSFQGGSDGAYPVSLLDVGGTLYGTTQQGGLDVCKNVGQKISCGVVFKLDLTSGAESLVHAFKGSKGGKWPVTNLIKVGGRLYGTTEEGGVNHSGTVFSLNLATGAVAILHSFGADGDGSAPSGSLVDVGGILYGTTSQGGGFGYGVVFALKP